MKIRQRWYRRHQHFNQSIKPSLLAWLLDTSALTSRPLTLCDDDYSVRELSQNGQKLKLDEATTAPDNTLSAFVKLALLRCERGSSDDRYT